MYALSLIIHIIICVHLLSPSMNSCVNLFKHLTTGPPHTCTSRFLNVLLMVFHACTAYIYNNLADHTSAYVDLLINRVYVYMSRFKFVFVCNWCNHVHPCASFIKLKPYMLVLECTYAYSRAKNIMDASC